MIQRTSLPLRRETTQPTERRITWFCGVMRFAAVRGGICSAVYLLALVMLATTAHADSLAKCTAASLTGAYGVQRNGHTASGSLLSAVGLAIFDGVGRVSDRETVSHTGTFEKREFAGSYTVNADCTGTITGESGETTKIAINDDGNQAFGISLVPANTEAVHYERVSDELGSSRRCDRSSFAGVYVFQRNGRTPKGDLISIGVITSDGQGAADATETTGRNGVFADAEFPGTYSLDADCTGTNINTAGNVFGAFVVVHDGREILGMSMTAGNNVVIHYEKTSKPPAPAQRNPELCSERPEIPFRIP